MSIHHCELDGTCATPPEPHPGAVLIPIVGADGDDETDVSDYRYDDCVGYAACLDHAACRNLDSWSCRRCPVFEEAEVVPIDVSRLITAFDVDHPIGE